MRKTKLATALSAAILLSCASTVRDAGKVLSGAQLALQGICEHVSSPNLDMALDRLEQGDLLGAAHYLRAELVERGHQPDVAALLALIESQIPAPLSPLPGLSRG